MITDENADISKYSVIYMSIVFTFTPKPKFYEDYMHSISGNNVSKFRTGGTGLYATEEDIDKFVKLRNEDVNKLEVDPLLPGLIMKSQMPDYNLYNSFIDTQITKGRSPIYYKDYKDYSIGFLSRGCFRHCPFCVNKLETKVFPYSELSDFVDESRPYIYLWDDNFLAAPLTFVKQKLNELIATNKPFQFRQGLDIRLIDDTKAELLSKAKYHGDFIFAFDNWSDRDVIQKKLKIWKKYNPHKTTKFYLFCGYRLTKKNDEQLFIDVCQLFWRIKILMTFGCLGYVMRHEDYKNHPLGNIYTQIARWCNQPQFYKKLSFHEFINKNQDYAANKDHKCMPLRTYDAFLERFSDRKDILQDLFDNVKYTILVNKAQW